MGYGEGGVKFTTSVFIGSIVAQRDVIASFEQSDARLATLAQILAVVRVALSYINNNRNKFVEFPSD